MNPAILVGLLLQYGPDMYKAAVELFHKPEPTKEDYLVLLQFAQKKSFDDYINEARAKAGTAPQPA